MPDNGILGGLGGLFSNFANALGASSPGGQQVQWERWQHQLYMNQLQSMMDNNPGMSINEAMYNLTPEGQKGKYGYTNVGDVRSASGRSGPVLIHGGQPIFPPGFTNAPQPVGQTTASQNAGGANGPTATQGQGGGVGPLSPGDQADIAYKAAEEGAKERASAEAKAQPGLSNVITDANTTLQQIAELQNHPGLEWATGAVYGRAPGVSGVQNDFVQKYNALLDSTFFQTLQQAKATGGRGGTNAAAALKASGRLLDPMSRTLTSDNFRKVLQDTADAIGQYKKDAWYNAGKPKDLEGAANSFTPKTANAAFAPGPGWHFSPSRNQYRDPQGKLYDSHGNPVVQ